LDAAVPSQEPGTLYETSNANLGADLSSINFDDIYYYIKPVQQQGKTWEEVPVEIKDTLIAWHPRGRAQIPRRRNSSVRERSGLSQGARRPGEIGVIFTDMDTALRLYPDLVKEHFGSIIPYTDNKFAALNSAVWSGGSFVYVPEGVRVEIPLQAYFRINAQNMGQFERTLIIAAPAPMCIMSRAVLLQPIRATACIAPW